MDRSMDGSELAAPAHYAQCAASGTVARAVATDDVLDDVRGWLDEGRAVATATVIKTWGSAPRPLGSQLAVNDRMEFVGSVSGGCVEAATVRAALDVMASGRPRRLSFGVSRDRVFDVGLTCGGEIQLYVECLSSERRLVRELCEARDARRSLVVMTDLASGERRVHVPGDIDQPTYGLDAKARQAALHDRSTTCTNDGAEWFLHVRHPPRRLVIVGAVHIAQALAPMAALNGFFVVLVDPREAFATAERFPGVELVRRWPHEVMDDLALDHRTAVVTLAHDSKLDDPALAHAAQSSAFYVGALGSHRSHAARLERLAGLGVSSGHLRRIRGPVGLPIGAVTTAEIATSIIADIVRTVRAPA
jgi:xanthine dehydrogenase accessory factor